MRRVGLCTRSQTGGRKCTQLWGETTPSCQPRQHSTLLPFSSVRLEFLVTVTEGEWCWSGRVFRGHGGRIGYIHFSRTHKQMHPLLLSVPKPYRTTLHHPLLCTIGGGGASGYIQPRPCGRHIQIARTLTAGGGKRKKTCGRERACVCAAEPRRASQTTRKFSPTTLCTPRQAQPDPASSPALGACCPC